MLYFAIVAAMLLLMPRRASVQDITNAGTCGPTKDAGSCPQRNLFVGNNLNAGTCGPLADAGSCDDSYQQRLSVTNAIITDASGCHCDGH